MKVTAVLKGKEDNYGKKRIYIRINEGKKRTFRPTTMKVLSTQLKKGKVLDHPQAKVFNEAIKKLIVETEAALINKSLVIYPDADFYQYSESLFGDWERTKEYQTLRRYKCITRKVKRFASSLLMSEITPEFLNTYQKHLFSIGNSINTVADDLKFIKLITLQAIRDKIIGENAFENFKIPRTKKPTRIYLSEEQIHAIEKYSLGKIKPHQKFIATWFLISCYTGLRYSDIGLFDKKNIKHGNLVIKTKKTGQVVSIPFAHRIKELLSRIDYRPMTLHNSHFNRTMKVIAKSAGIEENLHAHIARHTFATLALTKGIRIEVVGKVLGHSSLQTTQIYAKVINRLVDEEMKKMYQ